MFKAIGRGISKAYKWEKQRLINDWDTLIHFNPWKFMKLFFWKLWDYYVVGWKAVVVFWKMGKGYIIFTPLILFEIIYRLPIYIILSYLWTVLLRKVDTDKRRIAKSEGKLEEYHEARQKAINEKFYSKKEKKEMEKLSTFEKEKADAERSELMLKHPNVFQNPKEAIKKDFKVMLRFNPFEFLWEYIYTFFKYYYDASKIIWVFFKFRRYYILAGIFLVYGVLHKTPVYIMMAFLSVLYKRKIYFDNEKVMKLKEEEKEAEEEGDDEYKHNIELQIDKLKKKLNKLHGADDLIAENVKK